MKKAKAVPRETDSVYFLKILIYFVLGVVWIKFNGVVIFPAGLILGFIMSQKDHFAIDRKVEYAILLVAAVIGLMGAGFYLNINALVP
jgi:hypothetical protein